MFNLSCVRMSSLMCVGRWVGVWPCAPLYERLTLCLCVRNILPGLGRRHPSASTHYITSTHTETHTRVYRALATTCFVQHSSSPASAYLSCEVISNSLWDASCASTCGVIFASNCDLCKYFLLCHKTLMCSTILLHIITLGLFNKAWHDEGRELGWGWGWGGKEKHAAESKACESLMPSHTVFTMNVIHYTQHTLWWLW